MAPGSFVDELAVYKRLKISRTPLREALKVLTAKGLMRHKLQRGCFVNEVSEQDLDDIFQVIVLLERRCAFEATGNASDADLQALQVLQDKLNAQAKAGLTKEYYATNFTIREAIISLANNRWLSQSIANLRKILKLLRIKFLRVPGGLAQSLSEHMTIFAALKSRDSEGAEAAIRIHLLQQRDALRTLQGQQSRLTP